MGWDGLMRRAENTSETLSPRSGDGGWGCRGTGWHWQQDETPIHTSAQVRSVAQRDIPSHSLLREFWIMSANSMTCSPSVGEGSLSLLPFITGGGGDLVTVSNGHNMAKETITSETKSLKTLCLPLRSFLDHLFRGKPGIMSWGEIHVAWKWDWLTAAWVQPS